MIMAAIIRVAPRSLRSAFARFGRQERAAVAVEFAIFLPFLAMMLVGSLEVSSWIWARDRVVDAAAAIGDLASQSQAVDEKMVGTIFKAADAMLENDSNLDAKVGERSAKVSAILTCKCKSDPKKWCFTVLWSHAYDGSKLSDGYAVGSDTKIAPQEMGIVEGSTLIVSEITYTYYPRFRFILKDASFDQSETLFFRPRTVERIEHVGGQGKKSALVCS